MTYTNYHAERLKQLHDRDPNFGAIAYLWAPRIDAWMNDAGCASLLDYGCGKATLVPALRMIGRAEPMQEYDPATKPGTPEPADFVACIDVLEHVEKDKLDEVMEDIRRCTKKCALITVSLRNASPAGRKTHPLVRPREFWWSTFEQYFPFVQEVVIINPEKAKSELAVIVRPQWTSR